MKVLLLGEYSSLHMNLKEGLQELGCNVLVAGTGDGFKKVPVDISFDSSLPSVFGKISRSLNYFIGLPSLSSFDVVQAINPFLFHRWMPTVFFFKTLRSQNKSLFLLGAGDDAFFWRYGRRALRYGPFNDFLKYDLRQKKFHMESDRSFKINNLVIESCNGIIPIMYEYEISYLSHPKLLNTIPIPINTKKIHYLQNKVKNKVVVFHGLNRYGFKGTRHVESAFEVLRKKYPNDLELIIDGKMPIHQYLKVLKSANVVIDQLNSYSLGVNGVYALAMGKVVLGGAEPESLRSLGVSKSPVINLLPNSKSIVDAICNLLEDKKRIEIIGSESRDFAVRVHDHIHVASQYIKTWKEHQ